MEKIRLMQITHDLDIGGLQRIVVNICRNIDRDKFDVSVLCLRNLGDFVPDVEKLGIEVILLPQKQNGVDYFAFLKVADILRQRRIDVIHTHNTQPLIDGTLGALLAGVKRIVHTDHSRKFPDKRRYMFAERVLSHFIFKVVGVSQATSNDLMKYEKIPPGKIMTILNGIDGAMYSKTIDRDKKKSELGIRGRGPVIGLASRLSEEKGVSYLLRAMPEIIQWYPDIALIIAGKGKCENELKKEAAHLGIENNTLFIGPRLDVPELLKVFDLFVLPSLREGLPTALLEAMAAGCAIVATDVGGNHTAVIHGENGSLVAPKDSKALAREIIRVLRDEHLRSNYISKGLELFSTKFSSETMTAQYQDLYMAGRP